MRLRVCRLVLLAVQVWKCAGGEGCVDLGTQKEGKKSTPKGREAEVTSTVGETGRKPKAQAAATPKHKKKKELN